MASNSNKINGRLVLKTPSSSSSSPKQPPTPSQSPPPGVTMKLPQVNDHRSSFLSPELKIFYDQVFTALPQTPHFNPLENFRSMNIKEGIKVGCDIAFLNLVMKFHNLVDPSSFLSDEQKFTEEFNEFEKLGYELSKIRERFNLLKRRAEQEKALKDEAEKLEKEKKEREEKVEEKEFLLLELAAETAKVGNEVKMERSEIESIDFKRRKIMETSNMNENEFRKLAKFPW
ncbi:DUF724 domain-containing protein 7-like [Papaver somniferum]|uniref:DUF724 domain-containing protein 7-like n=1 Tax=Papaver somniferum TaxID=3469 RepID=UPI000E6FBC0E|nr:DUF724 domain-containing protein 7-like [Papaver somniferum]